MKRRDVRTIGTTVVTEYGIFDIRTKNWLGFAPDGGLKRLSPDPVRVLPKSEAALTADQAQDVLTWAKKRAGKTEDENGRWVALSEQDLDFCAVFGFEATHDLVVETGVEIEILRSNDILFDVKGPIETVDEWAKTYMADFPAAIWKTLVSPLPGQRATEKSVRIFRRRVPVID